MAKQHPASEHNGYAWDNDGRLVSSTYGDIYFSRQDGLCESRHVFLRGNGLQERFAYCLPPMEKATTDTATSANPFVIAEAGFGTGLNFLVTLLAWQEFWRKQSARMHAGCAQPVARSRCSG